MFFSEREGDIPLQASLRLKRSPSRLSTLSSESRIHLESKTANFCREQLGIGEFDLSPFRCRATTPVASSPSPLGDTEFSLRDMIRRIAANRQETATVSLQSNIRKRVVVDAPNLATSITLTRHDSRPGTGDARGSNASPESIFAAPSTMSRNANSRSVISLTERDACETSLAGFPTSRSSSRMLPPIDRHNSTTNTSTPMQTQRASLLSARAGSEFMVVKRAGKQSGAANQGPSFTPAALTRDDLSRIFNDMCAKIEAKATGEAEEKAAQESKANFKNIMANILKQSRPVFSLAKRYVNSKDKEPTPQYRMHIRAQWKFAAGRVLQELQKKRQLQVRDAKRKFAELVKLRTAHEAKERKKRRAELAVEFFADVMPKKASKLPQLNESWYRSLHARFREICDNEKMVLTVRDLSGKVDAVILRKIDRDHSGFVDFFELLKVIYPSILVRDLQVMMRKWDVVDTEKSGPALPTASLLSEESKRQIELMFKKCDVGGKGVLSKQDMMTLFLPPDWDFSEPLWFEKYFPLPSSVVAYDEFMEMVKFCYPPFKSGSVIKTDLAYDPTKTRGLPKELLDAQVRARIPD